jgi:hypothetical protein
MKKWLLVLLVLGVAVPAVADVFIYNVKQRGVDFYYDEDKESWTKSKASGSGTYLIAEPNYDENTVNIWEAETWKEKDEETGETYKYYEVGDMYTLDFLQTQIGKKLMWIISGTNDAYNTRIMLAGQEKLKKIGTENHTVAAALTGYAIWGDIVDEDLGGGAVSLTLNSKFTLYVQDSEEDAATAISDYLENVLGYEPY